MKRIIIIVMVASLMWLVVGFKGCGGGDSDSGGTSSSSQSFGEGGMIAYTPTGNIISADPRALAIDADDNLFVTGMPNTRDYFPYMSSWKFIADGALAWEVSAPKYEILSSGEDVADRNFEYSGGQDIAISNSGNVLVAGNRGLKDLYGRGYNWDMNMVVWSYLPDGSVDASFGSDGLSMFDNGMEEEGRAIVVDREGGIIVAGDIREQEGGHPRLTVWKLTSHGTLDTAFGSGQGYVSFFTETLFGRIYDLILDAQGRILVAGELIRRNEINNTGDIAVWRFLPDGALDTAFGNSQGYVVVPVPGVEAYSGQRDYASTIALDGQGRILVAGTSSQSMTREGTAGYTDSDLVLARLNDNGSLDTSFGSAGMFIMSPEKEEVSAGAVRMRYDFAENNVYVGGWLRSGRDQDSKAVLWKFTENGELDTSFADQGMLTFSQPSDGSIAIHGLEIDSAGNIIVLGSGDTNLILWKVSPAGAIGGQ